MVHFGVHENRFDNWQQVTRMIAVGHDEHQLLLIREIEDPHRCLPQAWSKHGGVDFKQRIFGPCKMVSLKVADRIAGGIPPKLFAQ